MFSQNSVLLMIKQTSQDLLTPERVDAVLAVKGTNAT